MDSSAEYAWEQIAHRNAPRTGISNQLKLRNLMSQRRGQKIAGLRKFSVCVPRRNFSVSKFITVSWYTTPPTENYEAEPVPHDGAPETNRDNSLCINDLPRLGDGEDVAAFDKRRRLCDPGSGNRPEPIRPLHRAARVFRLRSFVLPGDGFRRTGLFCRGSGLGWEWWWRRNA